MIEIDKNTETKVLDAAKIIFQRKGFDGARMQEIADEAGMNKALLHYYFRSKNKLFDAVFIDAFSQFIPKVGQILTSEEPLFKKIKMFVEAYINLLQQNPYLPAFVIHEVNRDPHRIIEIIKKMGIKTELLDLQIKREVSAGIIKPVKSQHLIVNMISMCVFPFIGRPIIQGFMFKNSKSAYEFFLEERKKEVVGFIINSIKKK